MLFYKSINNLAQLPHGHILIKAYEGNRLKNNHKQLLNKVCDKYPENFNNICLLRYNKGNHSCKYELKI